MRLIKGRTFYKEDWYNSYRSMMDRCYRNTSKNYKNYGGRGISVCAEWKNIENFEKWVKENSYKKGLTLDRINVNGNYEPSNCRWVDMKTQDNNRRNTVYVDIDGVVHTISELADITGIKRSTLSNRYYRGDRGKRLVRKVVVL